jgi:hypothetical protein
MVYNNDNNEIQIACPACGAVEGFEPSDGACYDCEERENDRLRAMDAEDDSDEAEALRQDLWLTGKERS